MKIARIWKLAAAGALFAVAITTLTVQLRSPRDEVKAFAREVGSLPAPGGGSMAVLPAHEFETAQSVVQWQAGLRDALFKRFATFGSALSEAPPVIERRALDAPVGPKRELIVFVARDGTRIPAIAQSRLDVTDQPAILVLPGHTPARDSGLRQLVFDKDSYQHAAATALAVAGFTTLTFELRGFGLLGGLAAVGHHQIAYDALQNGSFYKALVLDDAAQALVLLKTLPSVDPQKIGVAGASLGGELAVTLGALDSSISAIAFSSYGGHVGPFPRSGGQDKTVIHYCHIIPGQSSFLRQEDMVLLLAPRPTLGLRGARDFGAEPDYLPSIQSVWRLFSDAAPFEFSVVLDHGHEFFVEQTRAFFERTLAAQSVANDAQQGK